MLEMTLATVALLAACCALCRAIVDHVVLKRSLADLAQQMKVLRHANVQRTNLANEVAHDIKNPLTAILCSAEALDLLIGDKIGELHRDSLRYIKDYGTSLLQLMNDFIDISRAESGLIKSNPSSVKIAQETRSVLGLLDALAQRKSITLRSPNIDPSLQVCIDPKHFKQILFNLIHNAIKFTEAGGEIRVDVESAFSHPFVKVAVKDNGKGIPQEILPTIFNPYSRYEGQHAEWDVGTGLGLALCRELVELAHGEISVSSNLGVGTIFTFTIPVAPSQEKTDAAATLRADTHSKPLAGQKFLIVESDLGTRNAVARLIEAWGGMVETLGEAADAIEALSHGGYSAVMIDGEGDRAAAHELARMVKEDLGQTTSVIMATRDGSREQTPDNFDQVIEKPFDGDLLLKSLLHPSKDENLH